MRCPPGRSAALELILHTHPGVAFAADVRGRVARIDLLRVPHVRRGLGTMVYRAWESSLEPGTTILLDPVDDAAEAFWRKLGFARHPDGGMVRTVTDPEPRFDAATMRQERAHAHG